MSKKILIAEDDPFLMKVANFILKDRGYIVEQAQDGQEAWEKIEANGYDLILLDMIMPKKTGFDILKDMQKKKIKIPVLVFSNLSQEKDKKEALELGAKGYYIKSDISVDELIKKVDEVLTKKK